LNGYIIFDDMSTLLNDTYLIDLSSRITLRVILRSREDPKDYENKN